MLTFSPLKQIFFTHCTTSYYQYVCLPYMNTKQLKWPYFWEKNTAWWIVSHLCTALSTLNCQPPNSDDRTTRDPPPCISQLNHFHVLVREASREKKSVSVSVCDKYHFLDELISEYICEHRFWTNEYRNIFVMRNGSPTNIQINSP